jgi:PAS domain S-box-containing protein
MGTPQKKEKKAPKANCTSHSDSYSLRDKLMGFGEKSIRKSYYPELQQRISDLERFRNLLDETKDAIFLIEQNSNRIEDVNISAAKLSNQTKNQILGKKYHDVLPPKTSQQIQNLFVTQEESIDIEDCFPASHEKETIYTELNVKRVALGGRIYGVVVARDVTRRHMQEQAILQNLNEKEVLLREIHHRVKNNLQIISSLLSLQSSFDKDKDADQILETAQRRVRAMALVHEKLYQSENLARIDLESYIKSLTQYVGSASHEEHDIALEIKVDSVTLSADIAIPCGMIISELVSNSLKYAFVGRHYGRIVIEHTCTKNKTHRLTIRDNGQGLPASFNPDSSPSLGMRLVHTLATQIKATLKIVSSTDTHNSGTSFILEFPPAPTR